MKEETPIARLARLLGTGPEQAEAARDRFNEDAGTHVIITDRLEMLIAEKRRLYDTVKPEELRALQGFIDGATKALAALNSKE